MSVPSSAPVFFLWDGKTKAEYFDLVGGTTGRPPEIEVEPWDEPDEGEKLRASARPPEPAERKACSRFRPHTDCGR